MPTEKKRQGRKEIKLDLKQVTALAAQGLSEAQIAASLGISQDTLYRRKKMYTAFRFALQQGQAAGIAAVANELFKTATGQGEDPRAKVTAQMFYLKCRAGWQDRQEVKHSGAVNVDVSGSIGVEVDVSDEQAERIADAFKARSRKK